MMGQFSKNCSIFAQKKLLLGSQKYGAGILLPDTTLTPPFPPFPE